MLVEKAFNVEEGVLWFDGTDLALGPRCTKGMFLESDLGKSAKRYSETTAYSWWIVRVAVGGFAVSGLVGFEGERLIKVTLEGVGDEWGTTWEEFTAASERSRKDAHERWICPLMKQAIPESSIDTWEWGFGWGSVTSCYFGPHGEPSHVVFWYLSDGENWGKRPSVERYRVSEAQVSQFPRLNERTIRICNWVMIVAGAGMVLTAIVQQVIHGPPALSSALMGGFSIVLVGAWIVQSVRR